MGQQYEQLSLEQRCTIARHRQLHARAQDDPVLLQAQETFAKHLNLTWTPSLDGTKFILDFVAEQRPALKGRNPAAFVNVSFLKKLEEEEGFFRKLSGTPFFSEVFGLSSRSKQEEREKSLLDGSHSLGMAGLARHLACIASLRESSFFRISNANFNRKLQTSLTGFLSCLI